MEKDREGPFRTIWLEIRLGAGEKKMKPAEEMGRENEALASSGTSTIHGDAAREISGTGVRGGG